MLYREEPSVILPLGACGSIHVLGNRDLYPIIFVYSWSNSKIIIFKIIVMCCHLELR